MPFFHQVYYQFQKNSTLHLSLDENLIFDKDLDEYEIFKGDALIALDKKFVFDKSKNDVQFYLSQKKKTSVLSILVLRAEQQQHMPKIRALKKVISSALKYKFPYRQLTANRKADKSVSLNILAKCIDNFNFLTASKAQRS